MRFELIRAFSCETCRATIEDEDWESFSLHLDFRVGDGTASSPHRLEIVKIQISDLDAAVGQKPHHAMVEGVKVIGGLDRIVQFIHVMIGVKRQMADSPHAPRNAD